MKRKRRRKGESPLDKIRKETIRYDYAKKINVWKVERKLAEEILAAANKLEMNLDLDLLSKYRNNSFTVAIILQLNREDIYDLLSKDLQDLADEMDQILLREKVVEFMKSAEHPKISKMKKEFREEYLASGRRFGL